MGESGEKKFSYTPEILFTGDYINELNPFDDFLKSIEGQELSEEEFMAQWNSPLVRLGEYKGRLVRTFSERSKEMRGIDSIPEAYRTEIEELDTLVGQINILAENFFVNKSIDLDSFRSNLTELVGKAMEIIKVGRMKLEPKKGE